MVGIPIVEVIGEDACLIETVGKRTNWLSTIALFGTTAVITFLTLGQISKLNSLYISSLSPSLLQVPAIAGPGIRHRATEQGITAGDEEVIPLSDMLSSPDVLSPLPDARPSNTRVQLLDDDDIEIPSEGQKRGIRRMGHIDVSRWKVSDSDVGSSAVQIARLTARITALSKHLALRKKDLVATRRITELTSARRKLLNYLWNRDPGLAVDLIQELNIRWRTPDKAATLIPRSGPVEILVPANPQRPRTIPKSNQLAAQTSN